MASIQEQFKNYQADSPPENALSFDEFVNFQASRGNEEAKKFMEEEKDIESVAQPNTQSAYIGKDAKLGDAFKATSIDSYQVEDASNKRLAKETLALRDENEKLKIELGN